MKAISQFVWEKLSVLEGVTSTETLFIMRKYKETEKSLWRMKRKKGWWSRREY